MRELDLLHHIYRANAGLSKRVTIPPGDDMGAVKVGGADVLVTVDQIADGVHFDLKTTPLARIARKAITRNLSDVAAMAAVPVGAVVAACLPRDFGEARAKELFDHMRTVADGFACPLIGGDISMWDHPLLMSVTVVAESAGVEPVLRRGARIGDVVCVTGELGGSLENIDGHVHHLDFEPRLNIARSLASNPVLRPHCMIDLSDGLARDLAHLCSAAGLSAKIEARLLPLSAGAYAAANRDGRPLWQHAAGDGEDYELCFTLPQEAAAKLPAEIGGVPITTIGTMVDPAGEPGIMVQLPDGRTESIQSFGGGRGLGWEHHG